MANILELRTRKRLGDFKLDISATFPTGIIVIFGPSGSGKTTLLNCIAGLDRPDEGEIVLNGNTLFSSSGKINLPPERRRIGYMFQDSLLFPHLSVEDNIYFGYNLTRPELRRIHPAHLLDLLELEPLTKRKPDSLSVGERQRVVLARSLATSPDLLLLDEPLSSLHMSIKGRILRYLRLLDSELGIPMVYVTHSISEALALGHKALILDGGEQVAFGEPRAILMSSGDGSHLDVESLENLFDVQISQQRPDDGITVAKIDTHSLELPWIQADVGQIISIAIRAADIIIADRYPEGISARNILEATVEEMTRIDNQIIVHGKTDRTWLAEVTRGAALEMNLEYGQAIFLIIKSSSIRSLG